MPRCPFVYWAQDEKQVFLTVDLKDCMDGDYCINGSIFEFRGVGVGAQGKCDYAFTLALFGDAEIDKVNESCAAITFVLKKNKQEWWPHVTKDAQRPSWIRVDFNRYKDPDESTDEDDFEMVDVHKRTPEEEMDAITDKLLKDTEWRRESEVMKQMKKLSRNWNKHLSKYLFVYNMALFIVHLLLVCMLVSNFVIDGPEFIASFWLKYALYIKFVTAMQVIDIAHALSGFTKGSYRVGCVQVFGRLLIVYLIDGCNEMHNHMSTYALIVVYMLIEIIRYPYYGLKCLNMAPGWLLWLRYTAWIPLYPLGFLLEGMTIYKAIPYFKGSGNYSLSLPGNGMVALNTATLLAFFLATAFPFAVFYLLRHMWKQSCEKLDIRLKKFL